MTKITNAIALSVAIENLANIPTLNDAQGLNQLSDADKNAIIEKLGSMLESVVRHAENAKTRERKPSPKDIERMAENKKLMEQTFSVMSERPNFLFECRMLADEVGISTPRMARVLASLVSDGKVERIEGKKPNFKVKGE